MKRRSKISIIVDVLTFIIDEGGDTLATRVAQATGLAYDRLIRLLEELNEKGLVKIDTGERVRRVAITKKGLTLLSKLRELKEFLEDLGLEV
ncbi:MAG: winged helix-turn-helix domain-containing protein [Acidilobaceae archaeon]